MPYEEDKDPIEKANEEYQNIINEKNTSDADPQLNLNHEVQGEEEKKLEKLNNLIDTRIDPLKRLTEENSQKIDGLITEVTKIVQVLQGAAQPQQPAPQQTPIQEVPQQIQDTKNLLSQLPPDMAANALQGLLGGVAQLVAAWKSGGGNQEPNQFAAMSQEITTNLLRAGVDGIMQNVYHNYNPIPPQPSWNGNQQPQQQAPQKQNHTLE